MVAKADLSDLPGVGYQFDPIGRPARLHTGLDRIDGSADPSDIDLLEVGYQFGLVERYVMACTASNLAPIAKAVVRVPETGGSTRWHAI